MYRSVGAGRLLPQPNATDETSLQGCPLRGALRPALLALWGDQLGEPVRGGVWRMSQHPPASVPASQTGPGLPFGTLLTSRGCGAWGVSLLPLACEGKHREAESTQEDLYLFN